MTGLDYLRARYYDSSTGIFLTEDSYQGELTDPLSQNLYSYVHNNPVNYTDPSGHRIDRSTLMFDGSFSGQHRYSSPRPLIDDKTGGLYAPTTPQARAHQTIQQRTGVYQYTPVQTRLPQPSPSSAHYAQQQQAQARARAEQRRQQAIRDEYTQVTGVKGTPKSREGQNLIRNWGTGLANFFKHVCDPKTAKGKDDGKKKLDAGLFRKIEDAAQYGLTVQQKQDIDKLTLGQLQQRYPFLNQVNPYQGIDATSVHSHQYIISRYNQLLQASQPKPYSLKDDPSYQYHQSLVNSGIDPATDKKATPAQILHSRAVMASMVASPFVQSFSLAYNYSAYSKVTSSPKPVTVDVNPVDDVQHSVVGPVKSNIPSVTARFVNYNLADDVLNNHIIARHGSGSTYAHKSKFYSHIDIKSYIDDVLTDPNSLIGPNTKGKTGNIVVKTYSNPMGTDPKGNPVSSIKVVVDPQGNVITAYPIK